MYCKNSHSFFDEMSPFLPHQHAGDGKTEQKKKNE